MPVFRQYPYPQIHQRRRLVPAASGANSWHATTQEEPFVERRRNVTLAATGGEGYLGISEDGETWLWYAGPLGSDGRTLSAVASEAAAKAAPVALPADGRFDLPTMKTARYVRLGHRAVGGSSYTIREFYARRLVQTDDLEAECVTAREIRANTITGDKITATAIDGKTITGATIQTSAAGSGLRRLVLSPDGLFSYDASGNLQAQFNTTDGTLESANGDFQLNRSGLTLNAKSITDYAYLDTASVTWKDYSNSDRVAALQAYRTSSQNRLDLRVERTTGREPRVDLIAGSSGGQAALSLLGVGAGATQANLSADTINIGATTTNITGAATVGGALTATVTDANVSSGAAVLLLRHRLSSGTAAASFGTLLAMQADSTTTINQNQAQIISGWTVATHASRTAHIRLIAYDSVGGREVLRGQANGSAPEIGVLGAAPAARQTGGAKTAGATYGANEQTMLQIIYDMGRTFGFLT